MNTVEQAIKEIKAGNFIIVVDDEKRENEGDLILAAEKVTEENIAFMMRYTSGIICVSLTGERLDKLQIPLMVSENTEYHNTLFTISVDYRLSTTTGVSASDRAATIKALASPATKPSDFRRPGHIFPLRCREGGVLKRPGHTEAAIDLAKLAGLNPAGILCEIVNPDGSMARLPELKKFAQEHGLCLISVAQLIAFRRQNETLVKQISKARLPTDHGEFQIVIFESLIDGIQHVALIKGEISGNLLVRVHSECLTGDIFHSNRCDCGAQLTLAMKKIAEEEKGIIVYLRNHEGRGIGLGHKVHAYSLQDQGKDTVEANTELGFPADLREYSVAAQILKYLGVKQLRLLTNNPAKFNGLCDYGLEIVEQVPLIPPQHEESKHYIKTKQQKLGHIINFV